MHLNPPLFASLDLTYKCNLSCSMCGAWKIKKDEKELSAEEWKNVIDQLIQFFGIRFFRLVGGEPFLHFDFKEIVQYIKTRGCELIVVTNGTLIDSKMARFLVSEHVDRIRISVNGLEPIDDFYRGRGTFARTMKCIQNIVLEKKVIDAHFPVIEIHPFVSRVNHEQIKQLLILSRQFEADFNFHYMQGTVDEAFMRTQDPGFPKDPNKSSVMSPREKEDFERKFDAFLPFQERFLRVLSSKVGKLPIMRDCPRIIYHFLVDPWGYVFPCEHLYPYCYGNFRGKNVKEIWLSERKVNLISHIRKGVMKVCDVCGHRKFIPPKLLSVFKRSQIFKRSQTFNR